MNRGEEHELYVEDVENLDGSIIATDEAVHTLEESNEDVNGFVQTGSRKGDPKDLLKLDPGKNNPFKPKAKVFSAHEGGVIETFKHLEEGWSIDKLSEEEQETNALNAFNLAKQARDTATKTAKDSKAAKEGIKADAESERALAQSSLDETTKQLEGDTATQEDTDKTCKTKTEEWNERSKVRSGELEAMAMAKKILSKVTGVRNPDEHEIPTKALLESTSRVEQDTANYRVDVSFLQVDDPKVKAVNLLRQAASKSHSKALEKLAEEIKTYAGPFDKIKAMIQKMVFRLMGEQKDEDEHKLWCDMEMEKSEESETDKQEKVALQTSKVNEMDAAIKLWCDMEMEKSEESKTDKE